MTTIDLGRDCSAELRYLPNEDSPAGIMWGHPCDPSNHSQANWIPVGDTGHRWRLESLDPLTLSPSLLCRICGTHGFIRSGRWEPC